MLTNLQQKLTRRYTGTECYGSLIVNGPPTESKDVQTIDSISSNLKKRYTETEMYGTLIVNGPPTSSEQGPSINELTQGLKRRYTDTEMCGSLILHGPPTTPTQQTKSKWFDPMSEVRVLCIYMHFFGVILYVLMMRETNTSLCTQNVRKNARKWRKSS